MTEIIWTRRSRPTPPAAPKYWAFELATTPGLYRCPAWPGKTASRSTLEAWAAEAGIALVFIEHQGGHG